jgi:Glycosyltransferase Family 4
MTGALRILITNICLDNRSGTESVVRDLVINFARRGHLPTLYAPRLGVPADELRQCGGHVVDRLDKITRMPDVIHGHHNVPMVEAMATFSTCPAIFVSHDWRWWFDRPPDFERVHRYIAVDETRRDYLIRDVGIVPERVAILHNAVDLARIPVRQNPLGARPLRALAFTKTSDNCRRSTRRARGAASRSVRSAAERVI